MSTPSARATTRHRQAEHTVARGVSVTAATTPRPAPPPPPPARTPRGQGGERDGGYDRLPGDRAQPVLERRRTHQLHEKPQHGDAGGQTQQPRAKATQARN